MRGDGTPAGGTGDSTAGGTGGSDRSDGRTAARWRRAAGGTAVAAAVVGAFAVGSALGGGDPVARLGADGTGPNVGDASFVAFPADLRPASSCAALLEHYVERGLERVTAWGWTRPYPYWWDTAVRRDAGLTAPSSPAAQGAERSAAADLGTHRATSSRTGTNVQEAGVDEPDTVKTDGEVLVRVRGEELEVHDVSGPSPQRLAVLPLDGVDTPELLLAGDTVVVVGTDEEAVRRTDGTRAGTRVLSVDLADPAAPSVTEDVRVSASVASVRQHGDVVRLVVSAGLPDLDFTVPGRGVGRAEALAANRAAVEGSTVEDWLPALTDEGRGTTAEQLLDCTDVALPPDEVGLGTVAVVGFDAGDPTDVEAIGLAGATDLAYESTDHLYLAASPGWASPAAASRVACFEACEPGLLGGTSHLFDFELDGVRARHVASGEVEGDLRDRWSMDESGGVLRVAVGPTEDTGDFNSIVTLRRDGAELVEVGRLDRLGVREDIESVRWFDDLALVVTFRRVDPLYAVDLTDVTGPRLLGELKIPGFSSYLHPLGSKRLVGVGEGPTRRGWGAQLGLFDVTDLADVRRIDVESFAGGTTPLAGADPRAFTWVPEHRTVLTVVQRWGRTPVGLLATTRITEGRLETTTRRVEYGRDVAAVRTVPLGGGRVALVTGEQVQLLELG